MGFQAHHFTIDHLLTLKMYEKNDNLELGIHRGLRSIVARLYERVIARIKTWVEEINCNVGVKQWCLLYATFRICNGKIEQCLIEEGYERVNLVGMVIKLLLNGCDIILFVKNINDLKKHSSRLFLNIAKNKIFCWFCDLSYSD
jgi:hypothetical protein